MSHYSGYNGPSSITTDIPGCQNFQIPPGVRIRSSPIRLPPRQASTPSPVKSLSPPRHTEGNHTSRKLDNIFRHLVKWGSPSKDRHDKLRGSKSPSPPIGSPSKSYQPFVNHNHNNVIPATYEDEDRPSSAAEGVYNNGDEYGEEDEDIDELLPARARSRSLDIVSSRRIPRRRRYSGDYPARVQDTSQTHHTYTIYESIIQEGARRSSLYSHRPSDVSLDPAHAAILFRDSRGLPAADPFLERILNLSGDEENEILVKFFKFHKCYDLLPTSAKLVVFDTQLLVKKAFFALVYNGVRAAPLWDSKERQVIGMLTITDFIHVLHAMYHDSAGSTGKMSELEEHRVETWRQRFLLNTKPLISIDPDASLFDAICSLVNNRIHRLPVIDRHTGNVLHILTHKRILKFLFLYIHEIPRPSFLNKKLSEVRIGTFDNVETAREETPIIVALQKFLDRRVSALPIVDEHNRLLDIYARFDVINLAAEKTYNNLDITLKQANEHRNEWFEGVHKCTLDDTLFIIMEKIVKAEVHRLVVVDDEDRVTGVISLSDILQYIVMRPELKEVSVTDIEEAMKREQEAFAASADGPPLDMGLDQLTLHQKVEELNATDNDRENPTIFEEDDEKT